MLVLSRSINWSLPNLLHLYLNECKVERRRPQQNETHARASFERNLFSSLHREKYSQNLMIFYNFSKRLLVLKKNIYCNFSGKCQHSPHHHHHHHHCPHWEQISMWSLELIQTTWIAAAHHGYLLYNIHHHHHRHTYPPTVSSHLT